MGTHLFGVRLIGLDAVTAHKLLLTLAVIIAALVVDRVLDWITRLVLSPLAKDRRRYWGRQVGRIVAALVFIFGLISVWFTDPARLGSMLALVGAGLAVALQRVVTSFAAYIIILRGKVFTVGDRITMGGVRGDVISLGFMQTVVMEMGEPPDVQSAPPAVWVQARQYTGRIVRVTNDRIFESPVYNYTREFPYLWDEIRIPVSYNDDRRRAEQILLDAARKHTADIVQECAPALARLEHDVVLHEHPSIEPAVYWRLTDNWLELTLRFVARTHGVRALKNDISREILEQFDHAKIGIASGTYDIVGLPPVRVRIEPTPDSPPRPNVS